MYLLCFHILSRRISCNLLDIESSAFDTFEMRQTLDFWRWILARNQNFITCEFSRVFLRQKQYLGRFLNDIVGRSTCVCSRILHGNLQSLRSQYILSSSWVIWGLKNSNAMCRNTFPPITALGNSFTPYFTLLRKFYCEINAYIPILLETWK